MTSCTEVGGTKAEEDSYRAAITALVLEEVSAMLGTHLQGGGRREEGEVSRRCGTSGPGRLSECYTPLT